jgi:hypothetical protein
MTTTVASFNRRFQLWSYSVSHAQLLLRSTKDDQHQTQVDVLFKNVRLMCLPVTMDGLTITNSTFADLAAQGATEALGGDCFRLDGSYWRGSVVAGVVVWNETEDEFHMESKLLG